MKIFLTGATGYTGGVVLQHLLAAGHTVAALVRPESRPSVSDRPGLTWIEGEFGRPDVISEQAAAADGTVHIGAAHRVETAEMERLDGLTIRAVADALAGTGKVFINTSAAPIYGDTGPTPRDESEPILSPIPSRVWRLRHDRETVGMRDRGLRSVVIRPPNIYGHGGGVPLMQIQRARSTGKVRLVGEGDRLMSGIHADALARLYLAVLANERAEGVYNAASDEIVCARDVAAVIAEHYGPGIQVEHLSPEVARETLGLMAEIASVNCVISADRARRELGWSPAGPSYIAELVVGSYRALAQAS